MNANSTLSDADQKALALDLILHAWEDALNNGVAPEMLASTALFAVLTDMVDIHGEAAVAQFCGELPGRVRAGEFSLKDG